MKKTFPLLLAFVLGQLVQLMLHAIGMNFFPAQQVLLCAGAGIMLMLSLLIGIMLGRKEPSEFKEELDPPVVIDGHWVKADEPWRIYEDTVN